MKVQRVKDFEDMKVRIVTTHGIEIEGDVLAVADAAIEDPIGAHTAVIVRRFDGAATMVSVASIASMARLDGQPVPRSDAEPIGTCKHCDGGVHYGSDRMTLFDAYGRSRCPTSHAVHALRRR